MNDGLQISETHWCEPRYASLLREDETAAKGPSNFRGVRLFAPQHVHRVRFIKQAEELRFSLDEIRGLLATGGSEECRKVRDLLRRKLAELDERLKALKDFRRVLTTHLLACETELKQHSDSACCPVLPLKNEN